MKTVLKCLPRRAAMVLGVMLVQACGGGGDDPAEPPAPPPVTATPEGLWTGTATSAGGSTDVLLVVLGDGSYWAVYSQADAALGILQGTGTVDGTAFASADGRDYAFGLGVASGFSLASTFTPKTRIAGTTTYAPPAAGTVSFTVSYDNSYETPVTLAALAGTYTGMIGSLDGVGEVQLTVADTGGFTGVTNLGCRVSGNFTARGSAIVNMTASLDAATCGTAFTFNGVAGLGGAEGRTLILAAVTPDRSAAVYGAATRP